MSHSMSLHLNNKQVQSLRQTQRLIMSPQMQQAIHLLQLPVTELQGLVEAEMIENPILEYSDADFAELSGVELENSDLPDVQVSDPEELSFDGNDLEILNRLDEEFRDHFSEHADTPVKRSADEEKLKSFMESSIQSSSSLYEFLLDQARETFDDAEEFGIAKHIIGNLDERGFLGEDKEEIILLNNLNRELFDLVLDEIQRFEPLGVGASSVQESLMIQLKGKRKRSSLAYQIVEKHYDDLIHNRIPVIQKSLNANAIEVRKAIDEEIACLELRPGLLHSSQVAQHIVPDVFVKQEHGVLLVEVEGQSLPPIRMNPQYLLMLKDESIPEETRQYIQQKIGSGQWLMRNIDQRNETLRRISEAVVKRQTEFLTKPEGQLRPMTMKLIAEELDIHESTVARAVANKYIDTDRGLLPLRSFFTGSYVTESGSELSSQSVKTAISELVKNEDKAKPMSDDAISKALKEKGINCARRTVAKYRRELGLGNTSQRRVYG
ncbi:MAG: RNA polymerase sigma-54 factor [Waddliaceae bacterium]|nr:RNA polymerase sigma-54 factor [Waddliaceae bacterium]